MLSGYEGLKLVVKSYKLLYKVMYYIYKTTKIKVKPKDLYFKYFEM